MLNTNRWYQATNLNDFETAKIQRFDGTNIYRNGNTEDMNPLVLSDVDQIFGEHGGYYIENYFQIGEDSIYATQYPKDWDGKSYEELVAAANTSEGEQQ